MQRLPPPQWTCAHPADCAEGNTQRPIFSSLPVFPLGKPCYWQPESGQATSKVLPKGAWNGGGDGGHTLLLPGSALEDCGLPLRGELGAVPGGGTRSGEVWVLVGCLGLVIFVCILYLCFIMLWNLSDPRFHCNRFGTMRDCRCKYLPVSSELRRGGIDNWGGVGGRAAPEEWAGGRPALAARPGGTREALWEWRL